jgi:hypothetical protein
MVYRRNGQIEMIADRRKKCTRLIQDGRKLGLDTG